MLARLGGEEFGLLLHEADLGSGYGIAERLRVCVTHGQTCCVSLAQRRSGETIESVVRRADDALYDAEAAGRDLARAAVFPRLAMVHLSVFPAAPIRLRVGCFRG